MPGELSHLLSSHERVAIAEQEVEGKRRSDLTRNCLLNKTTPLTGDTDSTDRPGVRSGYHICTAAILVVDWILLGVVGEQPTFAQQKVPHQ